MLMSTRPAAIAIAATLGVSPAYLSQKLDRPIPTKDGGTLRTIREARDYMLALRDHRALRGQWQVAARLILEERHVATVTHQVELALFYEAELVLSAPRAAAACARAPAIRSPRSRASRRK